MTLMPRESGILDDISDAIVADMPIAAEKTHLQRLVSSVRPIDYEIVNVYKIGDIRIYLKFGDNSYYMRDDNDLICDIYDLENAQYSTTIRDKLYGSDMIQSVFVDLYDQNVSVKLYNTVMYILVERYQNAVLNEKYWQNSNPHRAAFYMPDFLFDYMCRLACNQIKPSDLYRISHYSLCHVVSNRYKYMAKLCEQEPLRRKIEEFIINNDYCPQYFYKLSKLPYNHHKFIELMKSAKYEQAIRYVFLHGIYEPSIVDKMIELRPGVFIKYCNKLNRPLLPYHEVYERITHRNRDQMMKGYERFKNEQIHQAIH